jgi:uncharacterized protein (TIGR02145 family)
MKLILFCFSFLFVSLIKAQDYTDTIEGKVYNFIRIGNYSWMMENLDVVTFSNGDTIPQAKTKAEWLMAIENRQPAWCYYNNQSEPKFGKLYNWFAVNDSRGLAHGDYVIPGVEAWKNLISELGGSYDASKKMKSIKHWNKPKDFYGDANGSNFSGFCGLPGGFRNTEGEFESAKYLGVWWTSSPNGYEEAYFYQLSYDDYASLKDVSALKSCGFSVRLCEQWVY